MWDAALEVLSSLGILTAIRVMVIAAIAIYLYNRFVDRG